MGRTMLPPYCLAWGQTVNLGSTGDSLTLTGKSYCLLWRHCFFLLAPSAHRVCVCVFVPSESLFLYSCGSSVIKSHWPPKSNSLGFSVPSSDPHVRKSVVSPRNFATVQYFLLYNSSPVCDLSAQWLYGGANGNLLQEDLNHLACLPSLLQPEPLFPGRPLLTCAS